MALFDLPLEQLRTYRPEREEPADFDAFWQRTLAEAEAAAAEPVFTPYDAALPLFEIFDVAFSGWGGDPVRAWLILPRTAEPDEPLPGPKQIEVYPWNNHEGGASAQRQRQRHHLRTL